MDCRRGLQPPRVGGSLSVSLSGSGSKKSVCAISSIAIAIPIAIAMTWSITGTTLRLSVHLLDHIRKPLHRDVALDLEGRGQETILDRKFVEESEILDGFE